MLALYCLFSRFLHDRKGVTAVEYAILAGVLVTAIVTAFSSLGSGLAGKLTTIIGEIGT